MKIFLFLISLTAAGFFFGCSLSSSPTSGGAHLPNFISGKIIEPNNLPADGTDVNLTSFVFDETGQQKVITKETVKTNEQGMFLFENIEKRKYLITASKNGLKTIESHISVNENDSLADKLFVLNSSVNIAGRVKSQTNPVSVTVAGTDYSTQTDSDGFYILEDVAPGILFLVFDNLEKSSILPLSIASSVDTVFVRDVDLAKAEGSQPLIEYFENSDKFSGILSAVDYREEEIPQWYEGKDFSKTIQLGFQQEKLVPTSSAESVNAFLIDNFDHTGANENLTAYTHIAGGFWYVFSDANDLDFSDGTTEIEREISIENPLFKNSLKVETILRDNSQNKAYAGVTATMGSGLTYSVDLELLKSVSFDIKGNGEIATFDLVSVDSSGNESVYYSRFNVNQDWSRVVIDVDTLAARSSNTLDWDEHIKNIYKIQFTIGDTYMPIDTPAYFYIDNIFLNGITHKSFNPIQWRD